MPTVFIRGILFISSYFPLMLIFGVLLHNKYPYWALAVLVVAVSSLILAWGYLRWCRNHLAVSHDRLTDYQKRDTEVLSYIASYLIPFVTFPFDTLEQVVGLIIFVVVLLILYVNTNMIYVNPMLNFVGYHLYEVNIEHSTSSHYYIARKRVTRDSEIQFVRLSDDVFLEK